METPEVRAAFKVLCDAMLNEKALQDSPELRKKFASLVNEAYFRIEREVERRECAYRAHESRLHEGLRLMREQEQWNRNPMMGFAGLPF